MLHNTTIIQPCLKCGQPVQIDPQAPLVPGGRYSLLFKCVNPDCPACLATFDSRAYTIEEVERYCQRRPR